MKKFLELIVKAIVEDEKAVKIDEKADGDSLVLTLVVNKEDMGRLIGKNGRIIKSIRNLLKIKAIRDGKRVFLDLREAT